jgi:pyruvate,water dikinase
MLNSLKEIMPFLSGPKSDLPFTVLFKKFKSILERNNRTLELMADMGDKLSGEYVFDRQYLVSAVDRLSDQVFKLISDLSVLSERKNRKLFLAFARIQHRIQEELAGRHEFLNGHLVLPLFEAGRNVDELDGGKMKVLSEMHDQLHLPIPDGFVITTKAFFDFMHHNQLVDTIEKGMAGWNGRDQHYLKALSAQVQQRIMEGTLPRTLVSQIDNRLDILQEGLGNRSLRLALRSSAWGEGEDANFAGQYLSMLNVPRDQVPDAYRRVLAGTYSYEAWCYRLERNYREHEIAMAVGCQVMADGVVSGALHTYADNDGRPVILINATWGLGAPLVSGEVGGDSFILARTPPYTVCSSNVTDKPRRLTASPRGGTAWEDVPVDRRRIASLGPDQLLALAEKAMTIERYYKRPQEIEWTFEADGRLHILQARPLRLTSAQTQPGMPVDNATRQAEVIFAGHGQVAQRGVAVGPVVVVTNDADLDDFPHGAILVSKYTTPRFSRVMCKARGIITDVGAATGHMANIAREYRVPTVVNTEIATQLLHDGDEITLDAAQNVVYRGRISELDHFELTEEMVFEESYEYRLLRRLLKHISPLHLIDPHGSDFKPAGCRTYHDITRFIHEKAVEELIGLSEKYGSRNFSAPKRLVSGIPLGLLVIDAGGGLRGTTSAKDITLDHIDSLPLHELLTGIHDSGMWCTEPVSVDMGNFMSSFTRTVCASLAGPQSMGRNLAVIVKEYMNLHMHLGYHFNIIDAYISETINDNYIYFRFLGGVTDFSHRSRRAQFISTILANFDFRVELRGDLVVGRIKKLSLPRMARRMRMLGGLIGYTRQLDARMYDDQQIGHHVDVFIHAIRKVIGGKSE